MSTVIKTLGPVTAYAYAVAGGYTGTEQEFEEFMADCAEAIPAPSSPSSGQYLVYNGTAWVAQSLPVYNGGVS